MSFYASSDGEHFELLEHVESRLTEEDEEVQIETFPCETTVDAQFLKIETVHVGKFQNGIWAEATLDGRSWTKSWLRLRTDTTFAPCRMLTIHF